MSTTGVISSRSPSNRRILPRAPRSLLPKESAGGVPATGTRVVWVATFHSMQPLTEALDSESRCVLAVFEANPILYMALLGLRVTV
jgi:hypothetical protein